MTTTGPKRLFVFCDGTGQDGGTVRASEDGKANRYVTNVLRLSRAVEPYSKDGKMPQIVFYQSGVASERTFDGKMGILDFILKSVSGWTVAGKIRDAYVFLAQNFVEGDEIFLFGFSRGAYIAKVLAGLIYKLGLLKTRELGNFFSYWKNFVKYGDDKYRVPSLGDKTRFTEIKCLGIWDAVGSVLGVKNPLGYFDTDLPENVKYAFHAVSIHENRRPFQPSLWTSPHTGRVKQVWFPGDHSDVGGSHKLHELADITLFWMAGEILQADLFHLNEKFIKESAQAEPKPRPWGQVPSDNSGKGAGFYIKKHDRLQSGHIDPTFSIFHESWKYNTDSLNKGLLTRTKVEDGGRFGHRELQYAELNPFEATCKGEWGKLVKTAEVPYDDEELMFD